ncbi:DUF6160 family protein [Marinobacter litoralis]|uniref:DUF6160 family protein n=1 Tax=Marinobacter litoralis TaxID=187981 RepID=UPI0018ECEDE9|nr:DUF6160 family protein [Marinobacter litoralis]MBJ6138798.1 hypothetical protein [Marinobacter litoralis]
MTTISRTTPLICRWLLMAGPVVLVSGLVRADMQSLDDAALSRVQGQSGITPEMELSTRRLLMSARPGL